MGIGCREAIRKRREPSSLLGRSGAPLGGIGEAKVGSRGLGAGSVTATTGLVVTLSCIGVKDREREATAQPTGRLTVTVVARKRVFGLGFVQGVVTFDAKAGRRLVSGGAHFGVTRMAY